MAKGFKFNPGFQTDAEAVANFVVRSAELKSILERLSEGAYPRKNSIKLLVVAPRGAGKTTLCRRVLAELRRAPSLQSWHGIFLGEESYGVTTPGEFFLECLSQLLDQTNDAALRTAHSAAQESKSEENLLKQSVTALRNYARAKQGKLLFIVENFHMIMRDQLGDGAEALLTALDEPEHFGILATSVVQAGADNETVEFREFKTIPLKPLTLPECRVLWSSLTGKEVQADRIRPLQILTGGSPRLMHILAEFMVTPSLHDLMARLNFLIDNNTEYFKSQLDVLPTIERKVFVALLDIWDPTTAKQIAEAARVTTNTASAMLARLTDRGSVIKEQGEGRAAIYFAAERLFNIYYLMRRRSSPSSRVKALVSFMTGYYDSDELIDTTAQLVREACGLSPDRRAEYHSTFDAIISKSPVSVRTQIIKQTPSDFLNSLLAENNLSNESRMSLADDDGSQADLSEEAAQLSEKADAAIDSEDLEEGLRLLSEALQVQPDSTSLLMKQTLINIRLKRIEDAISSATSAAKLNPTSSACQTIRGLALMAGGRSGDAEKSLQKALELDADNETARQVLADLRVAKGKISEAIRLFEDARELSDRSRVRYAQILQDNQQNKQAEVVLRKKLDFGPESLMSRRALIDLLEAQGRQEEGIALLQEAAEKSDDWKVWGDLGAYLVLRTDDTLGARSALERAIERGADAPRLFELLGQAMTTAGAPAREVSEVASEVERRFGNNALGWIVAGNIHRGIKDIEAAEAAYRKASTLERGSEGISSLARLLATLPDRREEAATLFREVIATHGEDEPCSTSRDFAKLLVWRGEDAEARKVLQSAIENNEDCYCCVVMMADSYARAGDTKKARATYKKALKLHENGVAALTGLSQLLEDAPAQKLIEKAIAADPQDPRPLLERTRRFPRSSQEQKESARSSLALDPALFEAHLFLAELEAKTEDGTAAITHLKTVLDALSERRDLTPAFVRSAVSVARNGHAAVVTDLIATHKNGNQLEPLQIATRILAGENPIVAKEVMEVATDILERSP